MSRLTQHFLEARLRGQLPELFGGLGVSRQLGMTPTSQEQCPRTRSLDIFLQPAV